MVEATVKDTRCGSLGKVFNGIFEPPGRVMKKDWNSHIRAKNPIDVTPAKPAPEVDPHYVQVRA